MAEYWMLRWEILAFNGYSLWATGVMHTQKVLLQVRAASESYVVWSRPVENLEQLQAWLHFLQRKLYSSSQCPAMLCFCTQTLYQRITAPSLGRSKKGCHVQSGNGHFL
jgi:hypothetical protein